MAKRGRPTGLTVIYALFDPREPTRIRYIGKTNNPATRLESHRAPDRRSKSPVAHWARRLRREDILVSMAVIENVDDWEAAEKRWIAHYRAQGENLLNLEDGGRGSWGKGQRKSYEIGKTRHFKELMVKASYIARNHELAGDHELAERARWSQQVVCRKRDEISAQEGPEALDAFDIELARECRPWKFYTAEQKEQIYQDIRNANAQ